MSEPNFQEISQFSVISLQNSAYWSQSKEEENEQKKLNEKRKMETIIFVENPNAWCCTIKFKQS